MHEQLAHFGGYLRAQRERAGLTIAHLARATKISPSLVAALENGEVDRLPQGVLLTQWVTSYAKATQAPVDEAVAKLQASLLMAPVELPPPPTVVALRAVMVWGSLALVLLLTLLALLAWSAHWVDAAAAF
jgi:cytoskeletal protein RodZ